jgi:hypothetical protein
MADLEDDDFVGVVVDAIPHAILASAGAPQPLERLA